jgi:hypothetical protein
MYNIQQNKKGTELGIISRIRYLFPEWIVLLSCLRFFTVPHITRKLGIWVHGLGRSVVLEDEGEVHDLGGDRGYEESVVCGWIMLEWC